MQHSSCSVHVCLTGEEESDHPAHPGIPSKGEVGVSAYYQRRITLLRVENNYYIIVSSKGHTVVLAYYSPSSPKLRPSNFHPSAHLH